MTKESKSMSQDQGRESPFVVLTHLHRDIARAFSRHMGMSFSRILVLHELMHTGEISQTELGQRLGMEGALLTRFAKQMEASGLISRRVDPLDNRFTLVSLTSAGQQVFKEVEALSEVFEAHLLAGLSEEDQARMVRSMKHIQDNLARWQERDD
jgi:DNA-binding MarR family transcriptional regulator